MPSSTPDWSALASKHEKVMDGRAAEGSLDPVPAAQHPAAQPGRHRSAAGSARRPRWRGRGSRGAAVATAAALAVTGVASVSASASVAPSVPQAWQIVKQVHAGVFGQFTAVTAVGKLGGWAFNGITKPTAWRRNGVTWTKAPFPGKNNESVVAAKASSPTNVWAFTSTGTVSRALRWDGGKWIVERAFSRPIGGAVVFNRGNVWVFGAPVFPGSGLGTWHFNGHGWAKVSSGNGLQGGSGLSAGSIWAFGGTSVAHWNGHTWSRTSVKGLLPKRTMFQNPALTAIYAQSASSVWAIANGSRQDEGGPLIVLHYNGHRWSQVAKSNSFGGFGVLGQVAPDGRGGLWIPMPEPQGATSRLVHYSGGHLTAASLPVAGTKIVVDAVAPIPGTTLALAGGFTHAANNFGSNVVSVILEFIS
jgi:hypothetical protein